MSHLEVRLLGVPEVVLDGRPLTFESRKGMALLAYLALNEGEQGRSAVAALLWPESDERSGRNALRYTLSILRKELNKEWLEANRNWLALPRVAGVWVDVLAFEEALAQREWQAAVELYRGVFMAGFELRDAPPFEDWLGQTAERLRVGISRALEEVIGETAEPSMLIAYGQRLFDVDDLNETAYRVLMRGYAAQGNFTEALRTYERCVARLYEELGVDPEPETVGVYEEVARERMALREGGELEELREVRNLVPFAPPSSFLEPSEGFVGRVEELEELGALMRSGERLVTVVAAGGMGKTRLVWEVAVQVQDVFEDGVVFVPLAGVTQAGQGGEHVVAAVAGALGLAFVEGVEPRTQLIRFAAERRMLWVLDNLEHLLEKGTLDLLVALLHEAPQMVLLVSSRERLKVKAERPYFLEGLKVPQGSAEAVALFLQRLKREVDEAELETVSRICMLVEGMPLAIELAAALADSLPLVEITAEIERNVGVLAADFHDLPDRHKSVRVVYDSAWARLSGDEQRVLARLAVFRGGGTLAAVQTVTEATVLQLTGLVDKALLGFRNGRYLLHELLRQYAQEKLENMEEVEELRGRHAGYYIGVLQENGQLSMANGQWAMVAVEIDNLRVGWEWFLERGAMEEVGEMVAGLWAFYSGQNRLGEAIELLQVSLEKRPFGRGTNGEKMPQLQWLAWLGDGFIRLGRMADSVLYFERVLEEVGEKRPEGNLYLNICMAWGRLLWGRIGGRRPEENEQWLETAARAGNWLVWLYYTNNELWLGVYYVLVAQRLAERAGHQGVLAWSLGIMHGVLRFLRLHRRADRVARRALMLAEADGGAVVQTAVRSSLAAWQMGYRSWEEMERLTQEGVSYAAVTGQSSFWGYASLLQAFVLLYQGRFQEAADNNQAAYETAVAFRNELHQAWTLMGMGAFLLRLGRVDEAFALQKQVERRGVYLGMSQIWLEGELALGHLWRGELQKAEQYVEQIAPLIDQKVPFTSLFVTAYAVVVVVYFALWEAAVGTPQEAGRWQKLQWALKQLRGFAFLHVIARPQAFLYWGRYEAARGRIWLARWYWRRGLRWSEKLDVPYQAGLIYAELGRYAQGAEREQWLARAQAIFERLGAAADLERLKDSRFGDDL